MYSYDHTGHGGGVWKLIDWVGNKLQRIETLDEFLKKIRS
jgi:hypothetical protein